MERFTRPAHIIEQQETFGGREVGLTHPDQASFFRLSDNGDIEIMACEGLGIILSQGRRSITFIADQVKFLTNEEAGFRWNKLALNPRATAFNEPTFTQVDDDEVRVDLFQGVSDYLETND
jgi:hypothetical protein